MPNLEEIPAERIADVVSRAVAHAVREGGDPESIVGRALARAQGELGVQGHAETTTGSIPHLEAGTPSAAPPAGDGVRRREVVTEDDVLAVRSAGKDELRIAPGAVVTPLARDAAHDAGIRLVEGA